MAASRKLQGEIDRCLKKVAEGVEQFEDIWKKVHNATNTNQKEKYEADLKKEIKKLQRLRDQIKSWLASGEIKDKTQLLDNRKLIETQMERFKIVERETKTKAYSKEGLGAAQNKDPAQKEKDDLQKWLNESIDSLSMQIDTLESEMEALITGGKKKKMDKDKAERIDELREWLEKHRFHIKKFEILLRMLNNESIDCAQLRKIKDDVDYYVESNQDPDFVENDAIYDDIEMEDLDYPPPEISIPKNIVGGSSLSNTSSSGGAAGGGTQDSTTEASTTPSPSVCGSSPAPSPASSSSASNNVQTRQENNDSKHSSSSSSQPQQTQQQQPPHQQQQQPSGGNNSSSSTAATVFNNHSNSNSANTGDHHVNNAGDGNHTERSSKRNKEDSRTPVKPQVVRPNTNSAAIISRAAHTPNKQVQGSTAGSTPNNCSTSSGMSYLAASQQQQHNAKNTAKNKEEHNNHVNSNILNHIAASQQQASAPPTATQPALLQPQQQQQQQQAQLPQQQHQTTVLQQQQQQQQQTINPPSSVISTPNGPLLHNNSNNNHNLHNKILSSTETIATSLKTIAQKKVNESSHHASQSSVSTLPGVAVSSSVQTAAAVMVAPPVSVPTSSSANVSSTLPAPPSSVVASPCVTVPATPQQQQQQSLGEAHIPAMLAVAPLGLSPLTPENELQFKMLQAAYYHMPHPSDSERLRLNFPRQPVVTPSHYPQIPPPASDTIEFFQRLSTETLFFIFYYLEGTKAQYLAAKALKKQSWRFHTKYMMWFQRHEEPKSITDEYEQGTYIFFDYDKWSQRKKENFTFEYRYLEDRDLN